MGREIEPAPGAEASAADERERKHGAGFLCSDWVHSAHRSRFTPGTKNQDKRRPFDLFICFNLCGDLLVSMAGTRISCHSFRKKNS